MFLLENAIQTHRPGALGELANKTMDFIYQMILSNMLCEIEIGPQNFGFAGPWREIK